MSKKDPGIATVLSAIIPGLGQFYNESIILGIIFVLIDLFFLSFILYAIGDSIMHFGYIFNSTESIYGLLIIVGAYLIVWLISIKEAQSTSHKINKKEVKP